MRNRILLFAVLLSISACDELPASKSVDVFSELDDYDYLPGYYDLYWDEGKGRLLINANKLGEPFLYQASLARGVGSNDLGLDRGQLGATRIVEFQRSGPKLLLVQHNLDYRALTDNPDEQDAVEESFARSVIWGFKVLAERDGTILIDATDFLIRDAHRIAARLAGSEEGDFNPDASRSAIYLPNTRAFPDNSEIEAIVTFTGRATGPWLPTVTPDAESFSVHLHHSFIRLPDDDYEPLPFEPRSGFGGTDFQDYATPVGEPLQVAFGRRHRLEKKDPTADVSEAVEPIIYYVDRGAPEPIRTALMEGAAWWNQAFEAAGYKDAFQVRLLPEDADPMDVRYNVIQWVHRSTRGWSYGGGITDPRTGEIMKGKVTLGSLRVRHDYLIAQGLLAPYDDEEKPDLMLQMALARIRQLAAHEVGHTLGIQHNMAASTQGRASVMDYPHPLIRFDENGELDLSDAYATGIGAWDKRVILYGYQDFPEGADQQAGRDRIMADTIASGMVYVADADSRAIGSAHPLGNLWDNGADSIEELNHLLEVRAYALARFSERNIRPGQAMATLEEVLVPLYLLHRFQLIAVGKLVGGHDFTYAMRGDGQDLSSPVAADRQRAAIAALLNTLSPAVLRLPENVLRLIPPRPPGHPKSRETFPTSTGKIFEPIGAAQSAASLTLAVLLEPSRAARMIASSARNALLPGFDELTNDLMQATWLASRHSGMAGELQRTTNNLALESLLLLAINKETDTQVRAIALDTITQLDRWLAERVASERVSAWRAHYGFARYQIEQMRTDPASIEQTVPVTTPPGEPIGTTPDWY
ncbi:MAG: zinc-dependent metalloprotease [Proteobacteria bacterium]|nr:zinc-dependent metalloprotease [Pseudomonadota bacterium]